MDRYDIAVIGAGFGGLSAALTAAERGAKVVLLEQLRYPGGCASTFTRQGARFESGATLFSGFAKGQLFDTWIRRHDIDVAFERLDPVIALRTPDFTLEIPPDRATFIDRLVALPDVPEAPTRAFFDEQRQIADVLWSLFDDPALLPPISGRASLSHLRRAPRYAPLVKHVGRTLSSMLARHGLEGATALETYLDAVCQITVQANAREVEAPFALAAMDYCFRGTGHVHGGIGELAWGLTRAIERLGGVFRASDRVDRIERVGGGYRIDARKGAIVADRVVANLTPHALRRVLRKDVGALPRVDALAARVEEGWGAVMLYQVLAPDAQLPPRAHHVEIVADRSQPFIEGNHLFVSVSGRDEVRSDDGGRVVTISTHVPARRLRDERDPGAYIARVQSRMRDGLARHAPEIARAVTRELTASPRTFERFTGRDHGYVGGIPRRAGLAQYFDLWPRAIMPGLFMVGDSVLAGQSTLATALGGVRVIDAVLPSSTRRVPASRDGRWVRV